MVMELPGVTRRRVESLGRQNPNLAIQVGNAAARLTQTVVRTFDDVNTAFDNAVVKPAYEREAISQYARAEYTRVEGMAELEAILNDPSGMVNARDVPDEIDFKRYMKDANGIEIRRDRVRAYEVAGDWYKQKLRTTQDQALDEMTNAHAIRKVKNDYGSSFMDNYAQILLNAQKQKLSYDKAELDIATEKFLEGGNLAKAEQLMLGAINTGTIGVEDGTARLMAMPGDVDSYRTQKAINTATLADLDGIEEHIYRDFDLGPDGVPLLDDQGSSRQNPMSFDQRLDLIKKLDAKRADLTALHKQGRDDSSERALNVQLIDLQQTRQPLDEVALGAFSRQLSPEDHQTLIAANKTLGNAVRGEMGDSDPATMSLLQRDINDLSVPVEGESPAMRRSTLMQRINQGLDDGLINPTDSWTMIQRIKAADAIPFHSEDMSLAIDQIYKRLTQGSKNSMGLNASPQNALNAADAERDLYDAARAAGPGFDPLVWMDKNFKKYMTRNLLRSEEKLEKNLAKSFLIRSTEEGIRGRIDTVQSRSKLMLALTNDTIGPETAKLVLALINEAAEKNRQRAAEREAEGDDRSWWWPFD